MKSLLAAVVIALAALGGAFAVFGGYDDSPGATLIGMLLVLGAMVVNVRAVRRRA